MVKIFEIAGNFKFQTNVPFCELLIQKLDQILYIGYFKMRPLQMKPLMLTDS